MTAILVADDRLLIYHEVMFDQKIVDLPAQKQIKPFGDARIATTPPKCVL